MDKVPLAHLVSRLRIIVSEGEHSTLQDQDLLTLFARTRDEGAFTTLVRRHGPAVLGVCRRVMGDWHEAEDVFQATFLILARKAASIQNQESLGSYLYKVAYRLALRARKAVATRRRQEQASVQARPQKSFGEVTVDELRSILDEELYHLPEKYRAPVLLCYLEGKTKDEAARLLGWSAGTTRGRVDRGRDLLRTRLVKRGFTLSLPLFAMVLSADGASATIPSLLVLATVRSALLYVSGQTAATGGLVSAQAIALANGALRGIIIAPLRVSTCVVAMFGLLTTGTGLIVYSGQGANRKGSQDPVVSSLPAEAPVQKFQDKAQAKKDRALGAELLEARTIQLAFKDLSLFEALAEFSKKTGLRLSLGGDFSNLVEERITLETGAVTAWEALDQFCRSARLVEYSPITTQARWGELAEDHQVLFAQAKRKMMSRGWNEPAHPCLLPLVPAAEGMANNLPTYETGAVRIRALPHNTALPPAYRFLNKEGKVVILLDTRVLPHIRWQGVVDARIDRAVDDQGQELQKKPNTFEGNPFWDSEMQICTGNAGTYPLCLELGGRSAQTIKELQGTLVGSVLTAPMPLARVENIFHAKGKPICFSDGLEEITLTVLEANHLDNGAIQLRLLIKKPNGLKRLSSNLLFMEEYPTPENGTKGAEWELYRRSPFAVQDAKARRVPLLKHKVEKPELSDRGGEVVSLECVLTYGKDKDHSEPTSLIFSSPRVLRVEIPFTLKEVPLHVKGS